jgi:outer membrane murein-binding lipoprotein Lpp
MQATRKTSVVDDMSDKEENQCAVCKNQVKSGDKGVQCEMVGCKRWFHIKCVKMSTKVYEVLNSEEAKNLHWYCAKCDQIAAEVLALNRKYETVQKEVEAVRKEVDAIKHGMVELREEMKKTDSHLSKRTESFRDILKSEFEKEMKQKVDESVKKEVEHTIGDASTEIKDVQRNLNETREKVVEESDKENRRANIILYRVPESSEGTNTERSKEDSRFCFQLLNKLNIGIMEEDIRKVFRLGRMSEDEVTSRPILIQFGSRMTKNLVMESLYKLKHADTKFRSVVIGHDMTKKEREECKALAITAKQRSEQETAGDWAYVVRGAPGQMKIVRVHRRN